MNSIPRLTITVLSISALALLTSACDKKQAGGPFTAISS